MASQRPRLVYDDDCGFCTWCAQWAIRNGDFEPVGFSELTADEQDQLPADWEECVHLLADGKVYSCGRATEEILVRTGRMPSEVAGFLNGFSDYERFREDAYRAVADRRSKLGDIVSVDGPLGLD